MNYMQIIYLIQNTAFQSKITIRTMNCIEYPKMFKQNIYKIKFIFKYQWMHWIVSNLFFINKCIWIYRICQSIRIKRYHQMQWNIFAYLSNNMSYPLQYTNEYHEIIFQIECDVSTQIKMRLIMYNSFAIQFHLIYFQWMKYQLCIFLIFTLCLSHFSLVITALYTNQNIGSETWVCWNLCLLLQV